MKKEKATENTSLKKELIWWAKALIIMFVITIIVNKKLIVNAFIPSDSMEKTLLEEDRVIANRLAYDENNTPERGDIAIFYAPDEEDTLYVKRVIGLPGEKVVIKQGKVYIDDSTTPLDEPYINGDWTIRADNYEFEVPEDSYLMLGDNRNFSCDARMWDNEYVDFEDIVAKAVCVYWPPSDMKLLDGEVKYK